MKKFKTYIVDAFTDTPFKGNPAGVCLLDSALTNREMLTIAKELGHSETAFLLQLDSPHSYSIRYFSPVMEIPLCGHATMASSKVLFERNAELQHLNFFNIQNIQLHIEQTPEGIAMEFPIYETTPSSAPPPLLEALGITDINNAEHNEETNILLLEISDSTVLRKLKPDFVALKKSHDTINGVLITAISGENQYDFESRYFWPWSGTNEDPVTGGTHTFLAKYWSQRLNKRKMKSFQCSERSGFMEVELLSDDKMCIRSEAQIVFEGELRIGDQTR